MPTDPEPLAAVARRMLIERETLVADLVTRTRAEISALDDDAITRSMLEASISENIVAALSFIARGISPDELEAPTAALAFARTLAQRDVPLSALIRAYRIGHSVFLDAAFVHLEEMPPQAMAASIIDLVRLSAAYIDRIVEQVGRTYELERDRWVASVSGVRQQWVNDLLSGRSVDLVEASRVLDYPIEAHHLSLVLSAPADVTTSEAGAALESARDRLVAAARARHSLLVPRDEREAQLWLVVAGSDTEGIPALEGLGVRVTQGWPAPALLGFRRSAAQARAARDLLPRSAGPAWVDYGDVAVASLLGADPGALRDVVRRTLGDLAGPGERNAMLRRTLATFLACRHSYAGAAALMNLHRNSVQYRVQQARRLLPESVAALDDDLRLRSALEAARWDEESVLG